MSFPSNYANKNAQVVDQSIYEWSTTKQADLGTRLRVGDRVFYYAQASASVAGGTVLCSVLPTASHQSGIFTVASTAVGAKIISGTSSANVAANYYAEGYFGVATGTNGGEMYRIKANASGSAGIAITLYDPLLTAITSGAGFFLYPSPFFVNVGSQALANAVGVSPANITSGAYFWMQTWGLANPVHTAATPAAADLSLGTLGGVVAMRTATEGGGATVKSIGKNSHLAATAAQNNPVFLTILP